MENKPFYLHKAYTMNEIKNVSVVIEKLTYDNFE